MNRDDNKKKKKRSNKGIAIYTTLALVIALFIGGLIYACVTGPRVNNINNNVGGMYPLSDQQVCYHNCQESCSKYPPASSFAEEGWSGHSHHSEGGSHHSYQISYESCFDRCTGSGPNPPKVNFKYSNGGYSLPTAIRFGRAKGDNPNAPTRMFVASQHGTISMTYQNAKKSGTQKVIWNQTEVIAPTLNINGAFTQGGLVGFELDPNFATNGLFYVMYSIVREDGNTAQNTPNCSTNGGYGSAGISQNRRNFGVDRTYDPDVYNDLLVIEQWYLAGAKYTSQFLSRSITIKHFFNTHYGADTLMFEENGKLLAYIADGGCHYDQYGVGQNRDFILGKIIYIDVHHNSTVEPVHWNHTHTPPPLPPYLGLFNCTTPVALWEELEDACPDNYDGYGIYASGCMDGGHMFMDRHNGVMNHYVTSDAENAQTGLYRFQYESNFGWVTWDAGLCTCIITNYFMDPVCDFNQTIAECLADVTSLSGTFTKPLVALNYPVDNAKTDIGGAVYRGDDLPCNLRGRYIWGDRSKWSVYGQSPHPVGQFRLYTTNPFSDQVNQANAHEILTLGWGLKDEENALYSIGYDKETNKMYIGVSSVSHAIYDDVPSTEGKVYLLAF